MAEKGFEKPKRKSILKGCLFALLILVIVLAVGGGIGWALISREHEEAASLPLNAVNFTRLNDGVYHGAYAGGMYKWRTNECDVTVTNGQVTHIQLVNDVNKADGENKDLEMLYDRVINAQSLHVDLISGATLTSKAYLQAVENALVQAEQK
jgi:uncharacterized protein with FMN-binding domain